MLDLVLSFEFMTLFHVIHGDIVQYSVGYITSGKCIYIYTSLL